MAIIAFAVGRRGRGVAGMVRCHVAATAWDFGFGLLLRKLRAWKRPAVATPPESERKQESGP